MPPPTFSVVITTYNRAEMLPRAVASVLAQTYTDFELIIVDDGSTDDTPNVLRAYAGDERIRYFRIENSGVARSRNCGIGSGTGEWIALLDDDNEWRPTYLEHQLAVAGASPGAGVVLCAGEVVDAEGNVRFCWPDEPPPTDIFRALIGGWFTWVSATLVRRDLFEQVGGFTTTLGNLEDIDLWLRLARLTRFVGTTDPLMIRHEHTSPRNSEDKLRSARSIVELDRRWRPEIIARGGYWEYGEWFRNSVRAHTVRALVAAPVAERRVEAARALSRLAPRLPWSATTMLFSVLMLALGPTRYEHLLNGYRRLRTTWQG